MISIDRRLVVSGCSYTDFCWNTWADFLSTEFASFENVGMAGADNTFIARSVINNARPGDFVVVLWSSFSRLSRYSEKVIPTTKDPNNKWILTGAFIEEKSYIVNYYHPVERFTNTMDYIQLVDLHSKLNGYDVYHFSAFPLFKGELETEVHPDIKEYYQKYNIKNNFLELPSLYEYTISNKLDTRITHYCLWEPGGDLVNPNDNHPTPLAQFTYAFDIIAPNLNIPLDPGLKNSAQVEYQDLITTRVPYKNSYKW